MTETLTRQQVADMFGVIAADEYTAAPGYAKQELTEYLHRLRDMSDDELEAAAAIAIVDSARLLNHSGNVEHIHCKSTAVFHESPWGTTSGARVRRSTAARMPPRCPRTVTLRPSPASAPARG